MHSYKVKKVVFMIYKEIRQLNLKDVEMIKIVLNTGGVIRAILLDSAIKNNMIHVLALEKDNERTTTEQNIAIDTIANLEIIK